MFLLRVMWLFSCGLVSRTVSSCLVHASLLCSFTMTRTNSADTSTRCGKRPVSFTADFPLSFFFHLRDSSVLRVKSLMALGISTCLVDPGGAVLSLSVLDRLLYVPFSRRKLSHSLRPSTAGTAWSSVSICLRLLLSSLSEGVVL